MRCLIRDAIARADLQLLISTSKPVFPTEEGEEIAKARVYPDFSLRRDVGARSGGTSRQEPILGVTGRFKRADATDYRVLPTEFLLRSVRARVTAD